jgi:hypothetical protein
LISVSQVWQTERGMPPKAKAGSKKGGGVVLAEGPKACLRALRSLAAVGSTGGDAYTILRAPSLWPHETHEDIK